MWFLCCPIASCRSLIGQEFGPRPRLVALQITEYCVPQSSPASCKVDHAMKILRSKVVLIPVVSTGLHAGTPGYSGGHARSPMEWSATAGRTRLIGKAIHQASRKHSGNYMEIARSAELNAVALISWSFRPASPGVINHSFVNE
jgi:hypothetical protein